MAEEIISKCSNLKITEDEEEIVLFDEGITAAVDSNISLSIVGRVLSKRPYNFEAFKRTMNQIWMISKTALFRVIENGLFIVQFATARDRAKVLDGRPWSFDQHLVLLDEIEGSVQPSDIKMNFSPFWIRIYNLPLDCRSDKHVNNLARSVGNVLEIDNDGVEWDSSARVKVMLDISRPLRRILRFRNYKGTISSLEIKYERVPTFCYVCGLLGHIERDCDGVAVEGETERQWGSWLRASPRRGRLKMKEETKAFLNCCRTLHFDTPSRGEGDLLIGNKELGRGETQGDDDMTHLSPPKANSVDVVGVEINKVSPVAGAIDTLELACMPSGEHKPVDLTKGAVEGTSADVTPSVVFPMQSKGDGGTINIPIINGPSNLMIGHETSLPLAFNVGAGDIKAANSIKYKKARAIKVKGGSKNSHMDIDSALLVKRKKDFVVVDADGLVVDDGGKRPRFEMAEEIASVEVAEVGLAQPREEP